MAFRGGLTLAITVAGILLLPSPVQALYEGEKGRISGFATLAAGKVSKAGVEFGDYRDEFRMDTDTLLGLQGRYEFSDRFSATAQVLSRSFTYSDNSDFEPELDWLFLSIELTDSARLRLGRLRTPHYLYSETLDIGYSYTWVRPPVDVYTPLLEPLSNFNGADLTFSGSVRLDEDLVLDLDSQFFAGQIDDNFQGIEIETEPVFGAAFTLARAAWKLRYAWIRMDISIENPAIVPLNQGFQTVGQSVPALTYLADDYVQEQGRPFYYHGVSASWGDGVWSVVAEAYRIIAPDEGFGTDAKGWYLSLAHTWGRYTPYVVIGQYQSEASEHLERNLERSRDLVPAGADPGLDALRAGAGFAIEQVNVREQTYTFGLRTELSSSMALKAEWQMFHFGDDSTGHMYPDFSVPEPDSAGLFTLSLDVVF